MKRILITGFATLAVLLPIATNARTTEDLQLQLNALMEQVARMQAQANQSSSANSIVSNSMNGANGDCQFTRNLFIGLSGQDVRCLQGYLIEEGFLKVSATGFFGRATLTAVQGWQRENGISSVGNFGQLSRAKYAKLIADYSSGSGDDTAGVPTQQAPTTPSTSFVPNPTASTLTADQIRVTSPSNTTVNVGALIKITYVVGPNIVAGNPAVIERLVVKANTDVMDSSFTPVTQSAGTYSFEWIPDEPGTYQALLKISLNGAQYTARSGVVTAVGANSSKASGDTTAPTSTSVPATPTVSLQASPTSIGLVQNSTLSWTTSNANRCILQYGSSEENVSVNGPKTISPTQTTSYRLWCVNDPGTGKDGPSAEKTISVSVASPSCTLTTDKSSYQYGETIRFSWTSQNATYATFWQDNSGKDHLELQSDKLSASGSTTATANVTGNPSATLLIYNYNGNSSCSVTFPVN
jgi:hypothetical protein